MAAPDVPTGGHVKRFSVNLTEKSEEAMLMARKLSQETQTEIVNRAVQWYAHTLKAVHGGGDVLVRMPDEEEPSRLHLF